MNKVIWKFHLALGGGSTMIPLPPSAQILCVQNQRETIYLWALLDPEATKVERLFRIYPTGLYADYPGTYVGTFQMLQGTFVGHVFEDLIK